MNLGPPEGEVPDGVLWWTFENQTVVGHALAVVGGVAVWLGVYLAWLNATGSVEYAAVGGAEAVTVRRGAWRAATTACWLWFSAAFLVGRGGPALNTVVYPMTLFVVGPWVVALALFRSTPDGVFTTASYMSLGYILDAVSIFLPAYVLTSVVIFGFAALLVVTGRSEAWQERHMPEEWHEIEVTDERFTDP